MAPSTKQTLVLALTTLATACAGHRPPPRGAAPATMASGRLPSGPAEPGHGLPMPSLDVPWTPPMLTAGDLEALRSRLAERPRVAIRHGRRFGGPEWSHRIGALVQQLRPQAQVIATEQHAGPFGAQTLPLQRAQGDRGTRPQYEWSGGPLAQAATEHEASAVLVLDDAAVEPGQWRALPARAIGSCEQPLAALAAGQEQSLAELEPFLDHADAVLWQVYGPALAATLPAMLDELRPYAQPRSRAEVGSAAAWEQHQCGHAYWEYLQPLTECTDEAASCGFAPRVFLVGGARVGAAEPTAYVPSDCAATMGRDYIADLRTLSMESAEVAREHLADSWVALADRLGAVTEVYETLEDVCTPRRRRFSAGDLQAMRDRLASIGAALASDEHAHPAGRWTLAHSQFHVPGFGPVHEVARYDPGPGSPSQAAVSEARALRQFVLQRALCRSGRPGLPLAVALVEGSGQVEFFGYFFEEELFCGELPPLWSAPSDDSVAPPPADFPPPAG